MAFSSSALAAALPPLPAPGVRVPVVFLGGAGALDRGVVRLVVSRVAASGRAQVLGLPVGGGALAPAGVSFFLSCAARRSGWVVGFLPSFSCPASLPALAQAAQLGARVVAFVLPPGSGSAGGGPLSGPSLLPPAPLPGCSGRWVPFSFARVGGAGRRGCLTLCGCWRWVPAPPPPVLGL